MRLSSFNLVAIAVGLAVFVGGGLWVWFGDGRRPPSANPGSSAPELRDNPPQANTIGSSPTERPGPSRTARRTNRPAQEVASNSLPSEIVSDDPENSAQWEKKIDDILTAEGDESQKAQQLLALLPTLPETAQIEAAQHLVNLVPDEGYAATSQHLTNAHTAEAVLDVLIGDLMNRPNTLKLPMLLQVARITDHPKAGEAKELLEFYVGEDLGTDWDAWEKSVTTWLKENPE